MEHGEQLRAMVTAFAAQLRKAFPLIPIGQIKQSAIEQLKRELPPHRGRPKAAHLDQAEQLRAQGLSYGEICTSINPRFGHMTEWERYYFRESIKRGLKQRRHRDTGNKTRTIVSPGQSTEQAPDSN